MVHSKAVIRPEGTPARERQEYENWLEGQDQEYLVSLKREYWDSHLEWGQYFFFPHREHPMEQRFLMGWVKKSWSYNHDWETRYYEDGDWDDGVLVYYLEMSPPRP